MASKLGTATVNSILDLNFGAVAFTPVATIYVTLFTTAPTDYGTGLGGVEVTGGSYARSAVTNNLTNFPAAASRAKANGTTIPFVSPTAAWGTVVAFGYRDALAAGNWLGGGDLTTNQTISSGNTVQFAIGSLTITLP